MVKLQKKIYGNLANGSLEEKKNMIVKLSKMNMMNGSIVDIITHLTSEV